MQLTNNFALSELTHSDTAKARGIDNALPPYLIRNAKALAERLQLIRDALGVHLPFHSVDLDSNKIMIDVLTGNQLLLKSLNQEKYLNIFDNELFVIE